MHTKYLFDANIFIQSHNLHYHPSFCEKFWDWINDGHQAGIFYSIDKIKTELVKPSNSDDELSVRLREEKLPPSFFVASLPDSDTAVAYRKLMQWLSNNKQYSSAAVEEFQSHTVADPFLVATAMAHDYVIVTQEKGGNGSPKRVKIPDAATQNGVKCINIHDLLRKHAENNFQLKY